MKSLMKTALAAGVAVLTFSAGRAMAQDEAPPSQELNQPGTPRAPSTYENPQENPPATTPSYAAPSRNDERNMRAESYNQSPAYNEKLNVTLGAGLADFTGSLGDHTNTGLGWNLRAAYELNPFVGVEAGYLGARNGIDDTRLPTSHSITTTGLQGDLKLGAPIGLASGLTLKPYLFGGVGAAYYGVSGDTPQYQSDTDVQIPLGVGGDAFLGQNVSVGARLGYFVNLANRIGDNAAGNQYNLTANVGVHY